jgi:predicted transcriptional regulator
MSRKVNTYLLTLPVENWETAQLLGSETNWKILESLREVGIQGLSAEELSKKVNVPISTVYNVLSKLQAANWVQSGLRRPQWGRPSKETKNRRSGKPTKIYIGKSFAGDYQFDQDFEKSLEDVFGKLKGDIEGLQKGWLLFLEKIVSMYENDEKLQKFFPHDPIHEECGRSHEGEEFLVASSLALLNKILSSKDYDELEKNHKFMK